MNTKIKSVLVSCFLLFFIFIYTFAQTTVTPTEYTAFVGQKVVLTASAEGTLPITYYWYKDNSLVGVSNSIAFTSVSLLNAGVYKVTAKNIGGETNSDPVRLIVVTPIAPNKVKITVTISDN